MEKTYLDFKNQGNALYKSSQYEKAIQQYLKAINFKKDDNHQNKTIYHNMALCYYKLQKFQECTDCCSKAIELDEHYAKAYYRRLFAWMKMDRHYEAYVDGLIFIQQCKPDEKAQVENFNIANKQKFLENMINFKADDQFFMKSLEIINKAQQIKQQFEKKVQSALGSGLYWQALNEINHKIMHSEGTDKQKLQEYYKETKARIIQLKQSKQINDSCDRIIQSDVQIKKDNTINIQSKDQEQNQPKPLIINQQNQDPKQQIQKQNLESKQLTEDEKKSQQNVQNQAFSKIQNQTLSKTQIDSLYKIHVQSLLNQSRDYVQDFFKMNQHIFTRSNLKTYQIRILILQIRNRINDLIILVNGMSRNQKETIKKYFKEKGLEDLLYNPLK